MSSRSAQALVFVSSGLVLVLEIIAGRVLAPYVGVSLTTFTAIIGTMLAGIAVGAAAGGWLADRFDPAQLIGPTLAGGGLMVWLSLPIVRALGPSLGEAPVVLVALAFLAPAAIVSAVSPMVAKLSLASIDNTGSVVGGLSASGTAGALVGTFLTGYVLVAYMSNRTIIVAVGVILVVLGLAVGWGFARQRVGIASAASGVVALGALFAGSSVCEYETSYYCVRIEVEEGAPSHRSLWLDHLRHGFVDLDDPTHHDVRYVRLLVDAADALAPGPIDALHIGGGAFSISRHVEATRPRSRQLVLEIDEQLVDIAVDRLGLVMSEELEVRVGDARLVLDDLPSDAYDLVIGDAFGSDAVPWHLTTTEVAGELARLLRADGVYAVNVLDGIDERFVAAMTATLAGHFTHLAVIEPLEGPGNTGLQNWVILASHSPLPDVVVAPSDGRLVVGDPWGDGLVLSDDYAPVDQLIG